MNNDYRPKGWKNPYLQDFSDAGNVCEDYTPLQYPEPHEAFEAGASKMLEMLKDYLLALGIEFREDGIYYHTHRWEQFTDYNWARQIREMAHRYGKCRVVFIPDEEQ